MPFDGIVTKAVANELNRNLSGGRIHKIYQPRKDTLILYIRANGKNLKLLLSCKADSARIHFTEMDYENPASPPMFCMLLRKHLSGSTLLRVEFHDYERILTLHVEAVDELGDQSVKKLIIEMMGRHSNIILLHPGGNIIDAIKHVDHDINRVREIMPARPYILPPSQNKISPEKLKVDVFIHEQENHDRSISKCLLSGILGFSPVLCLEICTRAGVDPDLPAKSMTHEQNHSLTATLKEMIGLWKQNRYTPCVANDIDSDKTIDFHAVSLTHLNHLQHFDSISDALDFYYQSREKKEQIKNRSIHLIRLVKQNIERCEKKIQIHVQTIEAYASGSKYRLYGELITANIHALSKGMAHCSLLNYYDASEAMLDIPLDENLTPQENAQRYFKKYTKAKNAFLSAEEQMKIAKKELAYLENVLYSLEEADTTDSVDEIREELLNQGYIKKTVKKTKQKKGTPSQPFHFVTREGYSVWVGRNNLQNDELTLRFSKPGDLWLHTKDIPGSHVIARLPDPLPDHSLLEAANLAAWFSKARFSSKVQIDYTRVKHVKKPSGAKPGMVIYFHYNTVIVDPINPEDK